MTLSQENIKSWEESGVVILRQALSADEVNHYKNIVNNFYSEFLSGLRNNYSIDKIDAFPERPFEGCQVNVMNMGSKKRKVIIESEKCLDLVSIYGEELYVKNLKYCLDKCNE